MPKLNKRQILQRILIIPPKQRAPFWKREYKLLNDFLKVYPNIEFWEKVRFPYQYDSLLILKSSYGKKILDKKYREYHYIIPEHTEYPLGETCGADKKVDSKPKTIREFLS